MSIKEDVEKVQQKIETIENQSFAMELLKDYKKQNKRLFWIIIVILIFWFITIGLFVYYINTTGYEIVTETAETIDGGNACVGNNCNNGEINYGKGKYAITMNGHITALIDGTIIDTFDCRNRVMRCAWRVE